jgi:hypothetical protein
MPGEEFRVVEQYVCPKCPDVGVHALFAVGYFKGGDPSKPCTPSMFDFGMIGVSMVTGLTPDTASESQQNTAYPNVWQSPPSGYYLGVKPANVDANNQIKLRLSASGETGCPYVKQEATVEAVVDGQSFHELCLQHNDMPPSAAFWTGDVNLFGKWVTVYHVVHDNPFPISVTHKGKTDNLDPHVPSTVHKGLAANGKWTFGIPDPAKRQEYINSGEKLCVKVYLSCNCP